MKTSKHHKSNFTKEERAAVKDLKKDDTIIILLVDKGKATVIMDLEDYEDQVRTMLSDEKTYEKLASDTTPKYTKKLVAIVDRLKLEGKLTHPQYKYLKPTIQNDNISRLYCTPKINPLRNIVDYTGSIAYNHVM